MIRSKDGVTEISIQQLETVIADIEKKNDKLVFEEHDVVKVKDPFTILLRSIIYKKQLTITQFKELVKNYYVRLGATPKQISQQPNNILRYIKVDKEITAKTFMLIVRHILQLEIKMFEAVFLNYKDLDENGKPKEEIYKIQTLK